MAGEEETVVQRAAQDKMLLLIAGFLEIRRASPTVREIAALYGCSPAFAAKVIGKLERRGLLYRARGRITAVNKTGGA